MGIPVGSGGFADLEVGIAIDDVCLLPIYIASGLFLQMPKRKCEIYMCTRHIRKDLDSSD